ncbi:MFS transporter [Lapidilactobacillus bayanensis]|uniref:MFS transporter n=1 Tax=Lapidilactobacillus bayanensis TaxID=2485998 RepID=UPI000F7993AA|nr:MFS transporter [Lapidilactobacillus bayanensis]
MEKEKKSNRQLRWSVISNLFGSFGSNIFAFGLSLLLLDKTGSVYSFAISSIVGPIVNLLLLPIVGPIIDKFPHQRVIFISQFGTIISLVLYFYALFHFENQLMLISILLIILLKISDSFTSTAQLAAKVNLVLPTDLTKLAAYTQAANSVVGIVSSVLGAVLYSTLSFNAFILFELFTEIATLLITWHLDFNFIIATVSDENNTPQKWSKMFLAGVKYVKQQRYLLGITLLATAVNFFSAILTVGLPILALTVMGSSKIQYGFTESCYGIGMIIGGWWLGTRKRKQTAPLGTMYSNILIIGLFISLIGLLPILQLSRIHRLILLDLALATLSFFIVTMNIPFNVWLQLEIPQTMQGRVFSILNTIGLAITPIGSFIYGLFFGSSMWSKKTASILIFTLSGISIMIVATFIIHLLKLDLKNAQIYSIHDDDKCTKESSLLQKIK